MVKVRVSVLRLSLLEKAMGVHLLWTTVSGNSRLQLSTVDAHPLNSPVNFKRNTLKCNTQLRVAFECVRLHTYPDLRQSLRSG